MRSGKLYIKISLTFLGLFFLALIVVFSLFIVSPGRHFTTRLEENNKAIALIIRQTIEDRINNYPDPDLSGNKPLKELIIDLSKILGAEVWLTYPDGTPVVKSFSGEIPFVGDFKKWYRSGDYGTYELYHGEHSGFYAVMPISFPVGDGGSIHVLVKKWKHPSPEKGFAFGLLLIGVVIALLIIPLSRYVIKPLKDLNESALQIADGDLSHRADVVSKDEIGQLCNSFNYMADKLESMIMRGKELMANVSHELRYDFLDRSANASRSKTRIAGMK
jgi:methyl-accepting chemotaxis protein